MRDKAAAASEMWVVTSSNLRCSGCSNIRITAGRSTEGIYKPKLIERAEFTHAFAAEAEVAAIVAAAEEAERES